MSTESGSIPNIEGIPNANMPIDITNDEVVENICGMVEVLISDQIDPGMKPLFASAIVNFIMMQHQYIKDPNFLTSTDNE